MSITWEDTDGRRESWVVRAAGNPDAYALSFRLPEQIATFVFKTASQARPRALQVKATHLASISIFYRDEGVDRTFRLEFDADATREFVERDR